MSVGYVYDQVYQKHDTKDHVEGKDRLTAIDEILAKTGLKEQLELIQPRVLYMLVYVLVYVDNFFSLCT